MYDISGLKKEFNDIIKIGREKKITFSMKIENELLPVSEK